MASNARMKCKSCAFRRAGRESRFRSTPISEPTTVELTLKTIMAARDEALAGRAERAPAVRWALAGLSLAMLLSSLGTSIANVALPTLAQAFAASFQQVQ